MLGFANTQSLCSSGAIYRLRQLLSPQRSNIAPRRRGQTRWFLTISLQSVPLCRIKEAQAQAGNTVAARCLLRCHAQFHV